jgi:hypothetical protein
VNIAGLPAINLPPATRVRVRRWYRQYRRHFNRDAARGMIMRDVMTVVQYSAEDATPAVFYAAKLLLP